MFGQLIKKNCPLGLHKKKYSSRQSKEHSKPTKFYFNGRVVLDMDNFLKYFSHWHAEQTFSVPTSSIFFFISGLGSYELV
jgi:hypothetical protein